MCEAHRQQSSATSAASVPIAGVTFQVSDMTCGHCAGVISRAIEETLPGAKFSIDIDKGVVTVDGDEALAIEAIRAAGYSPERVLS
ncbi:heavy metal transport/detoxification protein [Caballeronia pedi]|uniref:Heavy metal transport/detoxification protein n=1 Tax=Caballeronia pedi TaxID=1777141 RepID=A0A158DRX2_9BURK|nr:heavy-metal-associated domain-containing protein [Caballeronia pedi]SAK97344.1 heavy metal transport/detoxification protein [Caballeronia pedi]